jgi:hypothetical protein
LPASSAARPSCNANDPRGDGDGVNILHRQQILVILRKACTLPPMILASSCAMLGKIAHGDLLDVVGGGIGLLVWT